MELEVDARVALAESADDLGQDVTGLRVRGGDRQRTVELGRKIAGEARDVADFAENLASPGDDLAPRRRDGREALALAGEELHAEFGLELLQLFADAGLARV
jgi:hypothetical protein